MIELYSTIQYEGEQWIVLSHPNDNNQYRIAREGRKDIWVDESEIINPSHIQSYNRINSVINQGERFKELNYVKEHKNYFQSKGISEFNVFLENVIYHFYQGRTDRNTNFIYSICPFDVCKRIEYVVKDEIVSADVVEKESFVFGGLIRNKLLEVPTLIKFKMKSGDTWNVGVKREYKRFDFTKFEWR